MTNPSKLAEKKEETEVVDLREQNFPQQQRQDLEYNQAKAAKYNQNKNKQKRGPQIDEEEAGRAEDEAAADEAIALLEAEASIARNHPFASLRCSKPPRELRPLSSLMPTGRIAQK